MQQTLLRISEHGRIAVPNWLTSEQRIAIEDAAQAWCARNNIAMPPLWFTGTRGTVLCAGKYVGVIEAGGVAVEIYPKLDRRALASDSPDVCVGQTVLASLLWMMETAQTYKINEADAGGLAESPESFADVWAYLLARNLRAELLRGPIREYVAREDDLHALRGTIDFGRQATRLFGRMDKTACPWDEYDADIAVNQVLRCACRFLQARVRGIETRGLLGDCVGLLDDVSDVAPVVALQSVARVGRWGRGRERFRVPFELGVRLLRGGGHDLQTADADTWVFLLDMARVWEEYVGALLGARFGGNVETQKRVGFLFPELAAGRIEQRPDFYVREKGGAVWIGDAKYKHLTKDQTLPLRFADLGDADTETLAGRIVSPDDVRQLITYAELDARARNTPDRAHLMLLYPYVGDADLRADGAEAWNGSRFFLVPVGVARTSDLCDNLPDLRAL